jgi:hypothetical protein
MYSINVHPLNGGGLPSCILVRPRLPPGILGDWAILCAVQSNNTVAIRKGVFILFTCLLFRKKADKKLKEVKPPA